MTGFLNLLIISGSDFFIFHCSVIMHQSIGGGPMHSPDNCGAFARLVIPGGCGYMY